MWLQRFMKSLHVGNRSVCTAVCNTRPWHCHHGNLIFCLLCLLSNFNSCECFSLFLVHQSLHTIMFILILFLYAVIIRLNALSRWIIVERLSLLFDLPRNISVPVIVINNFFRQVFSENNEKRKEIANERWSGVSC